MNIRPWKDPDIGEIAAMEARCFSDPWSERLLREALSNPLYHCFLIEEQDRICGYCCLLVLFEDAEVLNVAVDTTCRRKGYGRALMDKMHETARELGAQRSLLEVRVGNENAIALYRQLGYEAFGVREKYYEDGESAYVMQKTL